MFRNKGYEVVLASPKGGPCPIDATSMAEDFFTDACRSFLHDATAVGALSHTTPLSEVDWTSVDAIYLVGGHGACVDFIHQPALKEAVESMYAANRVVAADCHGPIGLVECYNGSKPLVAGKVVTGFADSEEDAVQLSGIVPYLLESKFKELGAKYEKAENWHPKACVDGKLVTGQNPQSSEACAMEVIKLLG